MFETLTAIPPDPILGLMTKYLQDSRPNKVDLGVGVYKDESGHTPILASVKRAEQHRIDTENTKTYLGPAGSTAFNQQINELIFGSDNPALLANRIGTVSTPGGTAALRIAGDFIKRANPNAVLWISDPTWANHNSLFEAAGLTIKTYPYYDSDSNTIKFDEMMQTFATLGKGDVVVLHACCHNPTGVDLSHDQWDQLVILAKKQGFIPLIDMAYLGFALGIDEDTYGVRQLAANLDDMILCSSCSKNFGLYRERIGACSIVTKTSHATEVASSILMHVIRAIYSMPPAHGALIVATILGSTELKQQWLAELKIMRDRINANRSMLVEKLIANKVAVDFSYITRQKGMFSFLGLTPDQVAVLRAQYGIYMLDSSRINVAGISRANVDYLACSLAAIL